MDYSKYRGRDLFYAIQLNEELRILKLRGFLKGDDDNKTMNCDLDTVLDSLAKQYEDVINAFEYCKIEKQKKALADLINISGCVFLKLIEEEK